MMFSEKQNRVVAMFILVAAVALSMFSCSGSRSTKRLIKLGLYDCRERLSVVEERMERRRYGDAIRIAEEIKFQCSGSPLLDTVFFYAGTSHFRIRQFDEARFEFEVLRREFPRSVFVEEARFRVAQMRYNLSLPSRRDQENTNEAMRLLNDYLEWHPQGVFADSAKTLYMTLVNRLAEKDYNTARFYRRQRQHEAALIYYRSVIADYPHSEFVTESVVGMIEMLAALGRTQDAEEAIGELDTARLSEELRARVETAKSKITSEL